MYLPVSAVVLKEIDYINNQCAFSLKAMELEEEVTELRGKVEILEVFVAESPCYPPQR